MVTNCNQLKLKLPKDGKRYKTDVANTEQLLRIIQSVPSKKAEPFKLWLAQVGRGTGAFRYNFTECESIKSCDRCNDREKYFNG